METKIDYEHHLLQSRPNFAKALKDFETFLLATTEDLQNKFRVLESQKSNRKTSRNLKTYLSLQNFLLTKHLTRLHEFQNEIYTRVSIVFTQEDLKQNGADEQFLSVSIRDGSGSGFRASGGLVLSLSGFCYQKVAFWVY